MGLWPITAVGVLAASQLLLVLVMCRVQHAAAVRRRRAAFGPPPHPPSPDREGDWITLEGTLEGGQAGEGPLASSRAGRGLRHTRRGGPMRLVVGHERVALAPDVEVVVGSEERVPRDDEGRPDLLALTREVRAGDRVLVRGVLGRATEAPVASYRHNAIAWTLHGDGEPLRVAFDGAPRLRGTHRFFLAAMPSGWVAAAGTVAIVGAATVAGQGRPSVPLPIELGAPNAPAPPIEPGTLSAMSPEGCEAVVDGYRTLVDAAGACSADEDCAVDARGGYWLALDGCWRALGSEAARDPLDQRARAWLEAGCATEHGGACPDVAPEVTCVEGRCELK